MKLREGDRILCGQGHHAGDVLTDVSAGDPVPTAALRILGGMESNSALTCAQCGEVVAEQLGIDRWRVRTSRGWVS